jgi:Leucine-rich repeat (LRR) protein
LLLFNLFQIPAGISGLKNLKIFSASLNYISVLPSFDGCVKLETLDLAHNRLVMVILQKE